MSSANGFDPMAHYARLSERVENQSKDIVDLRSNMNTGLQTVNAGLSALSNEMHSSSKTQWPVIWAAAGVCFTVLVTIDTFFYGTLSKSQDHPDLAVAKLAEGSVSQAEMKWRTDRPSEYRARTDTAIKDLRDAQLSRREMERVWQANAFSTRDLLLDMRERQERLEEQIYTSRSTGG